MGGTGNATGGPATAQAGANRMLALLLVINLFNYIDRQVLSAVLPRLQLDGTIIAPDDPDGQFKLGLLTSAFMASYMALSLVFGWLDGKGYRRWVMIGLGVTGWSIASGSSGLATGYWLLFLTRCCVGIGEAAYAPIASAMLADVYPLRQRGKVIAIFNMAIPVGSALGFVIGGAVAGHFNDWRPAFWVTYAGLAVGLVCFLMPEPPRPPRPAVERRAAGFRDGVREYAGVLRELAGIRSYVLCCVGMTAIVYVIGGVAAWIPAYAFQRQARFLVTAENVAKLEVGPRLAPLADGRERTLNELKPELVERLGSADAATHAEAVYDAVRTPDSPSVTSLNVTFGGILVVGGFAATGVGAWVGERLRRKGVRGAYFWVIGGGALLAFPCFLGILYAPFPLAWVFTFLAICGLFAHTGPAFTLLANVVRSDIRATGFAVNILVIHLLGDAISPSIIGFIADRSDLQTAFLVTSAFILVGGLIWCWGARYLDEDTARVETPAVESPGTAVPGLSNPGAEPGVQR